jgi:hypothetical protein
MLVLLATHEGSESAYLLIDGPLGISTIPDIGLPIRVIPGHDPRIEIQEPPEMGRKSSRSAAIEAPEIAVKEALRVKSDEHGPRLITVGRCAEWAGRLDQMPFLRGTRDMGKVETDDIIVTQHACLLRRPVLSSAGMTIWRHQ